MNAHLAVDRNALPLLQSMLLLPGSESNKKGNVDVNALSRKGYSLLYNACKVNHF